MFPFPASITSGILIIIILAIRAITKQALPKTTYYILWKITLIKLLMPISVSSVLSIYNFIALPSASAVFDMIPVRGASVGDTITLMTLKLIETELNSGINILLIVWLIGCAGATVFFSIAFFRFQRTNNTAIPIKDNAYINLWLNSQHLRRTIRICSSDKLTTPITTGLLHPKIILPKFIDLNDTRQLSYILTHELVHIKKIDTLWNTLLVIALCIHWFNPAVWLLYKMLRRDMELSCDEQVINCLGTDYKKAYALSLLHMAQLQKGLAPIGIGFTKNPAEDRILSVIKYKHAPVRAVFTAVLVVLLITGVFATSASRGTTGSGLIQICSHDQVFSFTGSQLLDLHTDTFQLIYQFSSDPSPAFSAQEHRQKSGAPSFFSRGSTAR